MVLPKPQPGTGQHHLLSLIIAYSHLKNRAEPTPPTPGLHEGPGSVPHNHMLFLNQGPHWGFGHLFSGRYKALPVDGSGNGYLKTACDYVHLVFHTAEAPLINTVASARWSDTVLSRIHVVEG